MADSGGHGADDLGERSEVGRNPDSEEITGDTETDEGMFITPEGVVSK
jgi:hypothetical protein